MARPVAVIDAETDPFEYGQVPRPFAWGFYDGTNYKQTWGENATQEILEYLDTIPPHTIYAHNGGRFDFHFLLEHIGDPIRIINGRIAECRLGKKHILRDSFLALPLPLSQHDKGDIDYRLFHRSLREMWKNHIGEYLLRDCVSLFDWIARFQVRFGNRLTIGGASLASLRSAHVTEKTSALHDRFFRPWYHGGRVEFFERGILRGDWHVYDVNSMYPYVMQNFNHPLGAQYEKFDHARTIRKLVGSDRPYFLELDCDNYGCFRSRGSDGSNSFDPLPGNFLATSHEFEAAIATGLIDKFKIRQCWAAVRYQNFGNFVDQHHTEKLHARLTGDRTGELFAKLVLNSAYGKFGQNPARYRDYKIRRADQPVPDLASWSLACDWGSKGELWHRPAQFATFNDVAVAASITGAAHATLLRALCNAERPIYCDTDSIICEGLDATIGDHLGEWKLETRADTACIVGKKLYTLLRGTEFVKYASKGINVHPIEILNLARGKAINYKRDAPNFKVTGDHRFIERQLLPLEN